MYLTILTIAIEPL